MCVPLILIFDVIFSGARLRQVQSQLHSSSTDEADAILCINGKINIIQSSR
jgi:hypothetical protein